MYGVMYVLQSCVRANVMVSQLLLWHHLLWFVMISTAAFKRNVFAIKLDFFGSSLCAASLRCTCTVMHTGFRLI